MAMIKLQDVFAVSVVSWLITLANGKQLGKVPAQFFYDSSTETSKVQHGGCTVTSWDWDGMDRDGMSAPPWVSYVNCTSNASYEVSGVALHGAFQVWTHYGQISLNGEVLSNMGESFWVNLGAKVNVKITGAAYIAGAKFELDPSVDEAVFTSSFTGPKYRNFSFADAQADKNNCLIQDDDHINNGSSPSRDIVFGSETQVDPASVVVVNCAPGSTPWNNYVWSHIHPSGALYMPMSGQICFLTNETLCVDPGTARWTSANLQYMEYFVKINTTNAAADSVRDITGVAPKQCQYPNVFAVTSFDGFADPAGVPNFRDWPVNAHGNELIMGIAPWGTFERMTIQATKVVVKSVGPVDFAKHEDGDHAFRNRTAPSRQLRR